MLGLKHKNNSFTRSLLGQWSLVCVLCVCAWRGPLPVLHQHSLDSDQLVGSSMLARHAAQYHAGELDHVGESWHWHFVFPNDDDDGHDGSSDEPHSLTGFYAACILAGSSSDLFVAGSELEPFIDLLSRGPHSSARDLGAELRALQQRSLQRRFGQQLGQLGGMRSRSFLSAGRSGVSIRSWTSVVLC